MAIAYPIEGRNYILDAAVHNGAKISNWYVMLFEGDYTPQDSDTAANIGSRATEITAYSEATRPEFIENAPDNGKVDNQGSLAQFTMTAAKTIRGYALVSSAGKGTGTGKLLAIQKLATPKSYGIGDVVKVPITLSLFNMA